LSDPDRIVAQCVHMRDELIDELDEAEGIGQALKVAAKCGASSILPVDVTEAERRQRAESYTKFWLWRRNFKCDACGCTALCELTKSTDEERERWQCELDQCQPVDP
jgi:hypothetical protein